jgi:hypothetical protein
MFIPTTDPASQRFKDCWIYHLSHNVAVINMLKKVQGIVYLVKSFFEVLKSVKLSGGL